MQGITSNVATTKVSASQKYAINVEPLPASLKNNRDVHHEYCNNLRDTLDAIRKIELLAYVSASCPKESNKRDKSIATPSLTRKEHVTFAHPLETSGNNTINHVNQPIAQKPNVPIIHSTGVRKATKARRSKSKSNTINDKTLPANSVLEKKVEDHHRKNKSKLSKRTVLIQVKQKWKPTGKVFTTIGYYWKPTGRILPLGAQCPLTRNTKPKVVLVRQWKPTGRILPLGGQCIVTRSIASTSALIVVETPTPMVPIVPANACTNQLDPNSNWGSGTPNSPFFVCFQMQAPFLKEKKGVHFSALFLRKKRNIHGVVNRANIDYIERMWEEFTQSIHTFIDDKRKLAQHTQGKKKATIIVIPSVRFSKLIIHHLHSKHKFHPRPGSLMHLPNEEFVFGYLKFTAKGTKREVFGKSIPNDRITADIQGEQYYNAYLEKVAKHQRYLAGEKVSDPDSPAPKPAKAPKPQATKQSKPAAPKAALVAKPAAAKASKSATCYRPKASKYFCFILNLLPKPKTLSCTTESLRRRSEKRQTPKSSLQMIDEAVDKGVLEMEPAYNQEEADNQKAVEESLKDVHAAHQGLLPLVVIKESKSGKFQPLPEVHGKGKEEVDEEQAARVLLNLQTLKKKSPDDQYIFQRRTPAPTESSGHDESSLIYAELGLTDSETESDEEVSGIDVGVQDEGQAGSNPGVQDEGQAGPIPGNAVASQPPSIHVVHDGPNLEHMDLEASDTSIQLNPEQMDEEFTTTSYLNVPENLKLPFEGEVRLEEPTSSAGTLSSLQHHDKELSFTNQFLAEKSQEDEPEKTNTEAFQSMVTVPIRQDTSSVPLMTTLILISPSLNQHPQLFLHPYQHLQQQQQQ
ncbi:hypothetical protein Tco_0839237 [Tanacetum coccineum]|uniref:E-beta-farnesene synthase n=1 Tax=Tanacetum coccineum TaxID=301880 RepID=A0ABQ5AQ26_9ASTR